MNRKIISNNIVNEKAGIFYGKVEPLNRVYLKRFFGNVAYLLACRKISREKMKAEIEALYGFRVSISGVSRFLSGKNNRASLTYLQAYCIYLNEPLDKMISIDYTVEI